MPRTKIGDLSMMGSYMPILIKILENTDGKVLELGMGLSTAMIHMMCLKTKRPIVSYESDNQWFEKNKLYLTDWHQLKFVKGWDDADIDNEFWDVVLVDHHPARRRHEEVIRLANKANYIILHDTDIFKNYYERSGIYSLFKYRYDYDKCFPATTVLSNFKKYEF
jgi:hypothetical protein